MISVAVIGTQGLPAKYGGFETLVENLVNQKNSDQINYTVYCSLRDYKEHPPTYNGTKLRYMPFFFANGIHSIFYDIYSMITAIRGYDAILVLGTSGCAFLPIFRLFNRKRLVINIDGLEHRRAKWNFLAKKFLKFSESMAVKFADEVVVDNEGIAEYVRAEYGKESKLITYGADHVQRNLSNEAQLSSLQKYGLEKEKYNLALCRIEPENNCHVILEAHAQSKKPLVFIGNWDRSAYGRELKSRYNAQSNIQCLDAIYDLDILYALRKNCRWYIHGHSAGGTNPSLVEAMILGTPVVAFDCIYNRKTTQEQALYFNNEAQLASIISQYEEQRMDLGKKMESVANQEYTWKNIIQRYEESFFNT